MTSSVPHGIRLSIAPREHEPDKYHSCRLSRGTAVPHLQAVEFLASSGVITVVLTVCIDRDCTATPRIRHKLPESLGQIELDSSQGETRRECGRNDCVG